MRQLQDIARDQASMNTLETLTGAFEGIASMKISQTKQHVLAAQDFFTSLWNIYIQLRVDSLFRFGRVGHEHTINRDLFIVITAESGFSGDIDQKLIAWMLKQYDKSKTDIVVVGHHGAIQLAQAKVEFTKYYKLPEQDENINVEPLLKHVKEYRRTTVFYQTYESLMVQNIKRIDLKIAVDEQAKHYRKEDYDEIITEANYIFEPSNFAVVAHLERSMLQIAISQLILDSKLAQYASRFRAMSVANDRVQELEQGLNTVYRHTKRQIVDERLKEIIAGLKKVNQS